MPLSQVTSPSRLLGILGFTGHGARPVKAQYRPLLCESLLSLNSSRLTKAPRALPGKNIPKRLQKISEFIRFANKVADLRRVNRVGNHLPAIGAGENDIYIGPDLRGFRDHRAARRPRNSHVQQDHINLAPVRTKKIDSGRPIGGFEHFKAAFAKHDSDGYTQRSFIFHNQSGLALKETRPLVVRRRFAPWVSAALTSAQGSKIRK